MTSGPDDGVNRGGEAEESTRRLPPAGAGGATGGHPGARRAKVGPSAPPPPADSFRPSGQPPQAWPGPAQPVDRTAQDTRRVGARPGDAYPPDAYPADAYPAGSAQPLQPADDATEYPAEADPARRPPVPPPVEPIGVMASPAAPRRRRRRRRWPVITVIVLLALLVVADRAAVPIAESQMKVKAEAAITQTSKDPTVTPPRVTDVSIGGIPFLTQVLFGKYDDLRVTVTGISTPGPRISEVKARLQGVHVPFGDAIRDQVGEVPVDKVTAAVQISYSDLNTYLAGLNLSIGKVQVAPAGDGKVKVTVNVPFLSSIIGPQAIETGFTVKDNNLILVLPGGLALPAIPLPIAGLPFNLRIESATAGKNGIAVLASAVDVVLPAGS
ncbi:DUF2993 domain-containing protein [Frankia sp. CIT1]|uniref:LmeA family phospholipid-binding protein n=1 Tax=Frankia sp. CIT1 TaxID=2880974 RepID=UPI001EF52B63|nr:DUF2993 domain-containing protein [Frankia sp. CIT1]